MLLAAPACNAVKSFFAAFSGASSMSLLPWQGEKVADRPDEGIFPVHVGHESFTALPGKEGRHDRPKTATRDSIRQHSSPGIELTENLILCHECL